MRSMAPPMMMGTQSWSTTEAAEATNEKTRSVALEPIMARSRRTTSPVVIGELSSASGEPGPLPLPSLRMTAMLPPPSAEPE